MTTETPASTRQKALEAAKAAETVATAIREEAKTKAEAAKKAKESVSRSVDGMVERLSGETSIVSRITLGHAIGEVKRFVDKQGEEILATLDLHDAKNECRFSELKSLILATRE